VKRETVSARDTISRETTREWVERAKALKPLLEAAAPRIEQSRTLPPDVMDALHEAQMFRTVLPHSVGGAELNPATHAQVVAAIAEGDASAAWCIAQSACASMAAAYVDPKVAKEIWGDPRALFTFGFTSGNPPCLAVPVKGGWKVNGVWTFGSGSHVATWLGCHCRICDESGTPTKHPDGRFVERTMLIPRASVTLRDDTWDVMGLCGTGSDTYSVTDLFVPTEHSVVPRVSARDHQLQEGVKAEPEPERREKGILYRHSMQLVASAGLTSVAVGAAQAMLDAFIPLAKKKSPFNANQSLRDDGWIQARVAQADAKLASAKSWPIQLLHEAWDECITAGEVSFPLRIKLRQACTNQIDAAREVATMLFLEAGATAIFKSNPFERRLRDVFTVSIQVQGSIARMQAAGQYYLGLQPQQMVLIP
jgi:alkylation response protein AidB-like acyl-CoA dehydrogenase